MWPCSPTYGCDGPGLYGGRLVGIVLAFALLCLLSCWFINRRRRRHYFAEAALAQNSPQVVPWSPPWPTTNRVAWYGSPDTRFPAFVTRGQSLPYVGYQLPSSTTSRSLPPLPSPTYSPSSRSSYMGLWPWLQPQV
ncbi:hypothetical protein NEOLEDRAFT_544182 [Neolentinus lepideus HHB14362 ss-1]|uniref:Uncharacterized protein n=1 Tax=Neolentinus lepideus HHB14362 ss-1 TaxID=1314782 RepID=A0A165R7H6_9AGAM|nr:hypothetical protein NEOLEDRAFT_544182 [Neolentinus lepideus HHB14362 ss-1]